MSPFDEDDVPLPRGAGDDLLDAERCHSSVVAAVEGGVPDIIGIMRPDCVEPRKTIPIA